LEGSVKQLTYFVSFVFFVTRVSALRVDYLAIARQGLQHLDNEINEVNEESRENAESPKTQKRTKRNKSNLPDLMPQLWPIPEDPDIVEEMRGWFTDGTLARFSRERTFMYSTGMECVDLPQFARRLIARIDATDEGPHTRQRLELSYWTVRQWLEEKGKVRF
jgi:hypothetical protein